MKRSWPPKNQRTFEYLGIHHVYGTFDRESRVWKPVESQSWIGHGYHRHPSHIRNPPGSESSWAHSLTNAPTASFPAA
eukprot:9098901-Pyramimonas_sp.AAC.1